MKKMSLFLAALSMLFVAFGFSIVGAVSAEDGSMNNDAAETNNPFEQLRERWVDHRVPNAHIDMDNPVIANTIQSMIENAETIWERMETDNPDYLWANAAHPRNSGHLTTNFRNLRTMAEAYVMEVSPLFNNLDLLRDIIYGLDWMAEHRYNDSGDDYGNWWDFQIGAPQALNDTVVLIYDHLTSEQIEKYMRAVKTYVPDPTRYYSTPDQGSWTAIAEGANLLDLIQVVVIQGIISEEEDRVLQGREAFPTIEFKTSGTGNGLYFDGSFVDHNNIAYTGTYGTVLLGNLFNMTYLLEGSPYAIDPEKMANTYEMILRSFQPVIYRGLMMDMVNGRAISREQTQNIGYGVEAIEHMIQYANIAPPAYQGQLQSMVKEWLVNGYDLLNRFQSVPAISIAKTMLDDDAIPLRGELIRHYNFANMDRVVHRRPDYAFTISMYSDRIGPYEGNMNGENLKGHYTGSGMTYLYNDDLSQYNDHFWATVDLKRLAGITVNTAQPLTVGLGTGKTSPQSWVGGTTMDELYGVNGMYLDQAVFDQTLQAKKSWFMFDDEIVALGAGIRSEDEGSIETIVENRKLNDDGSNTFIVNGEQVTSELDWEQQVVTSWAHLEGNTEHSDIGYYFPEAAEVHYKREARTGSWRDVREYGSTNPITRNYMQMSLHHGNQPANASYSYVWLPNKSKDETAAYAANPDIEILANNEQVQAVKDQRMNLLGANFWENEVASVDRLTSYHKASVMVMETPDKTLKLSVSDPTHENKNVIELRLDYRLESLDLGDRVEILEQTLTHTKVAVRVGGTLGSAVQAEFRILPQTSADMLAELEEVVDSYKDNGQISDPLYRQLNSAVAQAVHHESNERWMQAVDAMDRFLRHLNAERDLDQSVKEALVSRVEVINYVLLIAFSGPEGSDEPDPAEDDDQTPSKERITLVLPNGSFEDDTEDGGIPGWNVGLNSADYEISAERAYDGAKSLKLTDVSTDDAVIVTSEKIPVIPFQEYTAQLMVYLEEGRTLATFHFYNEDGEKLEDNAIYIDKNHGEWQEVTLSTMAPQDAAYAEVGAMVSYYFMGTAYYDAAYVTTNASYLEVLGLDDDVLYTSDSQPTLTVFGLPESTIEVYAEDQLLGSARTTGEEQTIPLTELSSGEHRITVRLIFDTGLALDHGVHLIIDQEPPAAPTPITPSKRWSTNDRTPELVLQAEPGTKVYVKDDGEVIAAGRTDEQGVATLTTILLSVGKYHFTATAVDKAGNESVEVNLPPIQINQGKN